MLHTVPQNVCEFWAVATRPVAANGLGLSVAEALAEVTKFIALFPLSPDTPAVYPEWLRLVGAHHVSGKNAHLCVPIRSWRVNRSCGVKRCIRSVSLYLCHSRPVNGGLVQSRVTGADASRWARMGKKAGIA
jgi:hypothetical protein